MHGLNKGTAMDINIGYVWNQLEKAFAAKNKGDIANTDFGEAATNATIDAAAIANADKRVSQWWDVFTGILSGRLNIGARKPTAYPVWVTTEVVRGGFATGKALVATRFACSVDEHKAIALMDVPRTREALFFALLSDQGRQWLGQLIATRTYRVEYPEDTTLLVASWLHENGHAEEAKLIIDEILPYADELRFMPKISAEPLKKMERQHKTEMVHRYSANDVRAKLQARKPNKKIETQREALQIWIPFMDRLFFHWLQLLENKPHEMPLVPSDEWKAISIELLNEYENLKKKHNLCRKYHNKKENLQILLAATHNVLASDSYPASLNRARYVVDCYVKAHGRPADARFKKIREEQNHRASLPAHSEIAKALAATLPMSDYGLTNVEALLSHVMLDGHGATIIPPNICKIVQSAMVATIPELVGQGIVPSAETMAELTTQLTALEIGRAYENEDIGLLMAETYKAFARRRSLLLLNLASQVRFDELPWVNPLISEKHPTALYVKTAHKLAAYVIDFFPGFVLPNPLVEQLNMLYSIAGKHRPFLAELAADIFMGRFVKKFDDAAFTAAELLRGTIYERYYCLDYTGFADAYVMKYGSASENAAVENNADEIKTEENKAKMNSTARKITNESALLDAIVLAYLDKSIKPQESRSFSIVIKNGMLIELGQVYTTHNLATLMSEQVKLAKSYEELVAESFNRVRKLIIRSIKVSKVGAYRSALRDIKNAAYGWRQGIFFLSLIDAPASIICAEEELFASALGQDISTRLFERLKAVVHEEYPWESAPAFLGWTAGPHWVTHGSL